MIDTVDVVTAIGCRRCDTAIDVVVDDGDRSLR